MSESRPRRGTRADYLRFVPLQTRWHDNDVYGHVNNVVYYAWFDTAVNGVLIEAGLLELAGDTVGLVVDTRCVYFASLAFPQAVDIGMRVEKLGTSSVRYAVAAFAAGAGEAAAQGIFTHVYVDRRSQRPVPIPLATRAFLAGLRRSGEPEIIEC